MIEAFPLQRSAEFGNRPRLIGSRATIGAGQDVHAEARGTWQPGDQLLLMTDALAHWFLRRHEAGGRPWQDFARFVAGPEVEEAFAEWVAERRQTDGLRNDDVTLVLLTV